MKYLFAPLFTACDFAQTNRGSISGTVSDQRQAIMTGVNVSRPMVNCATPPDLWMKSVQAGAVPRRML